MPTNSRTLYLVYDAFVVCRVLASEFVSGVPIDVLATGGVDKQPLLDQEGRNRVASTILR
jgi:hypothetical protein